MRSAPPSKESLVPPVYMTWETLVSLGTGNLCQMPKGRGSRVVLSVLTFRNSLELWSSR